MLKQDVNSFYKAGTTVKAILWGAHPKNNLKTQGTFLDVQKKEGSKWKTVFTDHDICTIPASCNK